MRKRTSILILFLCIKLKAAWAAHRSIYQIYVPVWKPPLRQHCAEPSAGEALRQTTGWKLEAPLRNMCRVMPVIVQVRLLNVNAQKAHSAFIAELTHRRCERIINPEAAAPTWEECFSVERHPDSWTLLQSFINALSPSCEYTLKFKNTVPHHAEAASVIFKEVKDRRTLCGSISRDSCVGDGRGDQMFPHTVSPAKRPINWDTLGPGR